MTQKVLQGNAKEKIPECTVGSSVKCNLYFGNISCEISTQWSPTTVQLSDYIGSVVLKLMEVVLQLFCLLQKAVLKYSLPFEPRVMFHFNHWNDIIGEKMSFKSLRMNDCSWWVLGSLNHWEIVQEMGWMYENILVCKCMQRDFCLYYNYIKNGDKFHSGWLVWTDIEMDRYRFLMADTEYFDISVTVTLIHAADFFFLH